LIYRRFWSIICVNHFKEEFVTGEKGSLTDYKKDGFGDTKFIDIQHTNEMDRRF
jgi:hypothetical protein